MINLWAGAPLAAPSNSMIERRPRGEVNQAEPGEAERVIGLH
jgi:hypothetical protein